MTARTFFIRFLGLVVVVAIGAAIFVPSLQAKREEYRVRALVLKLQEGLQNFHVQEEIYPRKMMKGAELAAFLKEKKFLEEDLRNPWTGEAYAGTQDEDWLQYRTGDIAETYELIVFHAGTEEVQFRLDSTENQSLE